MPTSRRHFEIAGLLKRHPRLALALVRRALDRAVLLAGFAHRSSPIPTFHHARAVDAEATSDTVAERFADGVRVASLVQGEPLRRTTEVDRRGGPKSAATTLRP